jgi:hypothetical protein
MSAVRLQRAQHAYSQFISGLSPSQAKNISIGEPDGPMDPGIEVSRQEMLDNFLAHNGQFEPFREQLAEFRSDLMRSFRVKPALWNALTQ